jgi:hypothetical protein
MRTVRWPLFAGASLSVVIALAHFAMPVIGPSAYRWFGAPPLARAVERGEVMWPTLLTVSVATVFVIWALYAMSGAGMGRRLPLLRTALSIISVIYLLRGLQVVREVMVLLDGQPIPPRFAVFSAISLLAGVFYLAGTVFRWKGLEPLRV